jgi:phosphate transport system substrate-binding protein
MNDDFLRRARRPPSAAFERQLRERLRQQELNETSRRRPSWQALVISLLVGGSALAMATYLTKSRAPLPSSPSTADAPAHIGNAAQQEDSSTTARDNGRSSTGPSSSSTTQPSPTLSPTDLRTLAAKRPIRVVVSPDVATLAKDTSPGSRYAASASFEVDNADAALPTLCAEPPEDQPDIVVTSRRARKEDLQLCGKRYGGDVLEATLGHVAVVITRAKAGTPMQLSPRTLRLALLKTVPSPSNSSQLIDNPYTHWNQIDPELEDRRIEVLGPARDTPEFNVFAATVLAPGCENGPWLDEQTCQGVREDGIYSEARFDNTFVRQRLWSDPNVVAIVDYRFYAANGSDLLGSLLAGAAPTRETILDGSYAGSLTLRAYVNRLRYRNVPKVSSFVNEYLRLPAHLQRSVMIPPDANTDPWRPYHGGPKLTEVKLD